MQVVNAARAAVKTVADPNAAYESIRPMWDKCRAVCSGERYVKDYDSIVDTISFTNLLIPFSPSMTPEQYSFYRAEAELPGIAAQFYKMLIGGLLRKRPVVTLPEGIADEAVDWIFNKFGRDDSSLMAFLTECLNEELVTSRAWVFVDYPKIDENVELSPEEKQALKPYPVLVKGDTVINWRVREAGYGKAMLDRVIVKGYTEVYKDNEFHPTFNETVWVHELVENKYQIRVFVKREPETDVPVINGQKVAKNTNSKANFEEKPPIVVLMNGEPLPFIPAWPLNGSIEIKEPMLMAVIDKEVALYNKLSRRNHLLYGAATYTPVIATDMLDDEFDRIVGAGLGSWIRINKGDTATVLDTPTAALADMDRAIAASIEELAKLGIRMLTPETAQSGVALEIRNAAQTAQLGTLNSAVSSTMRQIIALMLNWKFALDLTASDIDFSLSADFNPTPLGADWLRLATEWYQQGLIPRSVWLLLLKQNDILDSDYNDEEGQTEISEDIQANVGRSVGAEYASKIAREAAGLDVDPTNEQTQQ